MGGRVERREGWKGGGRKQQGGGGLGLGEPQTSRSLDKKISKSDLFFKPFQTINFTSHTFIIVNKNVTKTIIFSQLKNR
jgi:hypothetical protein